MLVIAFTSWQLVGGQEPPRFELTPTADANLNEQIWLREPLALWEPAVGESGPARLVEGALPVTFAAPLAPEGVEVGEPVPAPTEPDVDAELVVLDARDRAVVPPPMVAEVAEPVVAASPPEAEAAAEPVALAAPIVPARDAPALGGASVLTTTPPARAASVLATYVVVPGDTLGEIANRFGVSAETVRLANNLGSRGIVRVGQSLQVPREDGAVHTVAPGETLARIATSYGADPKTVAATNDLGSGNLIRSGQRLVIPGKPRPTSTPTPRPAKPTSPNASRIPVVSGQ